MFPAAAAVPDISSLLSPGDGDSERRIQRKTGAKRVNGAKRARETDSSSDVDA